MKIEFKEFSKYQRGIMLELLRDSYQFDSRYERDWLEEWKKADNFFYSNLHIADQCGFITVLNHTPIGFICWDPRNTPAYAEIGHNCIATKHKGKKYGQMQLLEAVSRIKATNADKILVTTDEHLIPAQRNYERAGFTLLQKRENKVNPEYAGSLIDYEMKLKK